MQLRVNGMNLRPWRNFISRQLAPKKLPLFSKQLTVSTDRKTKGQNTWYEMEVGGNSLVPRCGEGVP